MGLDQYLYAKNYLSPMEWRGEEMNERFHTVANAIGVSEFMDKDLPSIQCQVKIGYWRKANAIHDWFVQNCQDGNDDCRESYVPIEKLEELRKICKMVLGNHALASEYLPTASGFFFGTTDYDEWYYKDLESTVAIIDNALSKISDEWTFAYQSSW
ncbi:MAG: hypothetical protein J0651_01590 [Actinobacteria bacterium]|nr:hypothetical protein [Actinomycetota bacterium]